MPMVYLIKLFEDKFTHSKESRIEVQVDKEARLQVQEPCEDISNLGCQCKVNALMHLGYHFCMHYFHNLVLRLSYFYSIKSKFGLIWDSIKL